jgi:hypothetical protein
VEAAARSLAEEGRRREAAAGWDLMAPPAPVSFDSVYDLEYDPRTQRVTFLDTEHDAAHTLEWAVFAAWLRATYHATPELVERVKVGLCSGKAVRLAPAQLVAAFRPPVAVDFEQLNLRAMYETVGLVFRDAEERAEYYRRRFGVVIL